EAGCDRDDDRYRETSDQGHAPRLPQHAHTEHDVEREPAEPREAARIVQPVQHLRRPTCLQPREARGLARRVTFATQVLLDHLEMKLELALEITVAGRVTERAPEAVDALAQGLEVSHRLFPAAPAPLLRRGR